MIPQFTLTFVTSTETMPGRIQIFLRIDLGDDYVDLEMTNEQYELLRNYGVLFK